MADRWLRAGLRDVCQAVAHLGGSEPTDAELLGRFTSHRDGTAFAELLRRHGPKVLGICRRVLRHTHDAEDAFQATFLLLARAAGGIGNREVVGGWLYRVAYRVALRARGRARRTTDPATSLVDLPAPDGGPNLDGADIREAIDAEVSRLPAKYRDPFVLCYFDGKTNDQAARELGCPKGTLISRLAWVRVRLRDRLARRGLVPAAGLVAAGLVPVPALARVPPELMQSTSTSAALIAAGGVTAGAIPAPISTLMTGAIQTMRMKQMLLVAGLLAVAALGVRAGFDGAASGTGGDDPQPVAQKATKPADSIPPGTKAAPTKPVEKIFSLELTEVPWPDVIQLYSKFSELTYVGQAEPKGTVTIRPPVKGKRFTLAEITDLINEALLAQKFILVRREKSFTVLQADEKIDQSLLPNIRPEDLDQRGSTELVVVTFTLVYLSDLDGMALDVRKLTGPFGRVVTIDRTNQLVVQDTVGGLRRIRQVIRDADARQAEKEKKQGFPPPHIVR